VVPSSYGTADIAWKMKGIINVKMILVTFKIDIASPDALSSHISARYGQGIGPHDN